MADNCITEREDAQGYWWCYRHSPSEPAETFEMAIRVAGEVAAAEARRRGKTYIVASTSQPPQADMHAKHRKDDDLRRHGDAIADGDVD